MQMREENVEMWSTITVRHDDGDAMASSTVTRSAYTARQHGGVLTDDICLSVVMLVFDVNEYATACTIQ